MKFQVPIAQSVERKTEDLEAACSIHARDTLLHCSIRHISESTLNVPIAQSAEHKTEDLETCCSEPPSPALPPPNNAPILPLGSPEAPGVPALIKTPIPPPAPPNSKSASMTITPYHPYELPSSENSSLTESTVLPPEAQFLEDQSTDAATIFKGNLKLAPLSTEVDPRSALSIKIP